MYTYVFGVSQYIERILNSAKLLHHHKIQYGHQDCCRSGYYSNSVHIYPREVILVSIPRFSRLLNTLEQLLMRLDGYLIIQFKPVLLIMAFVRAEREGEWTLHLWAVSQMMPYFYAAGHINYARYGMVYLRSMEKLEGGILDRFMRGEHVSRHQRGLWNGMWTDVYIDTTLMRYGHGPGGIVGITLNEHALCRWALSLHICSRLTKDIADLNEATLV